MAKVVPNKKEELSVKIAVDTSELDTAIKKIKEASYRAERLSNVLKETKNLISYIFPQKSVPAESEQNYESLKRALFESALSCENEEEKARREYRQCFALDGSQSVGDNYLKNKRNTLYRGIAQSDILLDFIKRNGLIEEYQKYKSKEVV